jgi:hypothetical protein
MDLLHAVETQWALITIPGYGSIFMDVGLLGYDHDTGVITFETE